MNAAHHDCDWDDNEQRAVHTPFLAFVSFLAFKMNIVSYSFVVVALDPSDETQKRQDLRLYPQGDVELFDDVVHAQRHTRPCPEHHHRWLKTRCIMSSIINDDLRNQLLSLSCGLGRG